MLGIKSSGDSAITGDAYVYKWEKNNDINQALGNRMRFNAMQEKVKAQKKEKETFDKLNDGYVEVPSHVQDNLNSQQRNLIELLQDVNLNKTPEAIANYNKQKSDFLINVNNAKNAQKQIDEQVKNATNSPYVNKNNMLKLLAEKTNRTDYVPDSDEQKEAVKGNFFPTDANGYRLNVDDAKKISQVVDYNKSFKNLISGIGKTANGKVSLVKNSDGTSEFVGEKTIEQMGMTFDENNNYVVSNPKLLFENTFPLLNIDAQQGLKDYAQSILAESGQYPPKIDNNFNKDLTPTEIDNKNKADYQNKIDYENKIKSIMVDKFANNYAMYSDGTISIQNKNDNQSTVERAKNRRVGGLAAKNAITSISFGNKIVTYLDPKTNTNKPINVFNGQTFVTGDNKMPTVNNLVVSQAGNLGDIVKPAKNITLNNAGVVALTPEFANKNEAVKIIYYGKNEAEIKSNLSKLPNKDFLDLEVATVAYVTDTDIAKLENDNQDNTKSDASKSAINALLEAAKKNNEKNSQNLYTIKLDGLNGDDQVYAQLKAMGIQFTGDNIKQRLWQEEYKRRGLDKPQPAQNNQSSKKTTGVKPPIQLTQGKKI